MQFISYFVICWDSLFLNTEPIQVLFCQMTTDTTLRQIQTFTFHFILAGKN